MSEVTMNINPLFSKATAPFINALFPAEDLLPIVPLNAKIGSKAIDARRIGKVPGRFLKSGAWVGLTGTWATHGLNAAQREEAASWPTANVGLRAENWPAVDADVNSEEVLQVVENLITYHLGNAPARVRDNSPRALFVFRRIGDEPVRKIRVVFKCDKDIEHAVEVLGLGQQYLVAGSHPSGAEYTWREDADILTWGAKGLTCTTALDLRMFADALVAEIQGRGWTVVNDLRLRGSSGGGIEVKDLDPILPTDLAIAALGTIPNTPDTLPMREDLVGVLAGFKATVGRNALQSEVIEAARDWATKEGWADADYFDGVWASLTHVRVGPDRFLGLAHKHGFVGDAAEDFADGMESHAPIIAKAQTEEEQDRARLEALSKRVVYWSDAGRWIDKETKSQLSHSSFNTAPHLGITIAPAGATGTRTAANRLLNADLVQTVSGLTYLPGQPQIVTWENHGVKGQYFNKWTAPDLPRIESVTDADVAPWLDHLAYLFEDENDRACLLDFFAHIVQRRGHKIRWAPIIIGNQGVGKDLMLRPLVQALGKNSNAQTIQPERLMGNFIDFWEKELVIVEEITRSERTDVYERMKAVISGTAADTNTVERKFEMPYEVPNVVNFVFFSNHSDALNLSSDDRRFFVIHSYAEPKDTDYYEQLNRGFYERGNGWLKVYWWLKQRDISKFNPDARPPMNEAKQRMIEDAAPYYFLWLRDEYLNSRSVVVVKDILDAMATDFNIPETVRKALRGQAQVAKALKFAGWVYRAKQVRLTDTTRTNVFCRTEEIARSDASLIKTRYLAEKEKKLVNVSA